MGDPPFHWSDMRTVRQLALVAAGLLVAASPALAQRTTTRTTSSASSGRVIELGADAALRFGLDDPNVTQLDIPVANIRVGFFRDDTWSFEPFGSIMYIKTEGVDAFKQYTLGLGVLYHLSPSRTARQVYIRPMVALVGFSAGPADDSDLGIGIGAGVKLPRMNGRIAWRGEANLFSAFDQTTLGFFFGLSVFPR